METALIIYALEVLCCSGLFLLLYRLFFSKCTHFKGMRFYLLASLILPLLLPLLTPFSFEFPFAQEAESIRLVGHTFRLNTQQWLFMLPEAAEGYAYEESVSITKWGSLLLGLYVTVVLFRLFSLFKRLHAIRQMLKNSLKERRDGFYLVWPAKHTAPFSFLHYLFLGRQCKDLSPEELEQVMQHELVHIRQRHSLDLLLLEAVDVFLWFNIFHRYLRHRMQEVHEYLADEAVSQDTDWKDYARLLLKISASKEPVALSAAFTARQIGRRILMLGRARTAKWKRMGFAAILPLSASLVFLFSCLEEVTEYNKEVDTSVTEQNLIAETGNLLIGDIYWEGNSVYSDAELNQVLGLSSGAAYSKELINNALNYNTDKEVVSDLYMDHGYLFFSIEVVEMQRDDQVVDLKMQVYEGIQCTLDRIIIRGNVKISDEEILEQLEMRSGDLFNRTELIAAQRKIAEMGFFDPKKVQVNPIPVPENGTLDIEFTVTEL